jgi:FkbM family methyltransferase
MPTPERVLDLGSNIGLTVAHYAVLWPEAKIVGVEMAIDLVAHAAENTDVPILPVAVGSVNGVARFRHTGTWGTTHCLDPDGNAECIVWTIPRIAQVCFGGEIDFCKMDVEGEEWDLFAHPEWVPYVKHLLVELHGGEAEEMKERGLRELDAIGFDASVHEIHPHALWAVRR